MSVPDLHGALADGRRFRASSYALEITSDTGQVLEQIDLQELADVGRDGNAVSLRLRDGQTKIFVAASLDDAGRMTDHMRRSIRPAAPQRRPPPAPPPPVTRQTVRVERSAGSTILAVIFGGVLVVIIVLLAILAFNAVSDDGDDEPTAVPTEAPAEPTTEPEATPEARAPGFDHILIGGDLIRPQQERTGTGTVRLDTLQLLA